MIRGVPRSLLIFYALLCLYSGFNTAIPAYQFDKLEIFENSLQKR